MDIAADGTRILENLEAALLDDRWHSEIHEASRMKQGRPIAGASKLLRKRWTRDPGIRFSCDVECGIARTQDREQSLDAFRIHSISAFERDPMRRKRRQIRHRIDRRITVRPVSRRR